MFHRAHNLLNLSPSTCRPSNPISPFSSLVVQNTVATADSGTGLAVLRACRYGGSSGRNSGGGDGSGDGSGGDGGDDGGGEHDGGYDGDGGGCGGGGGGDDGCFGSNSNYSSLQA